MARRETVAVSLPGHAKGLVERAASARGLTTSDYVRLAIFDKLWRDAVNKSRRVAVAKARVRGVFTDEDVFRLIS